MKNKGLIITIIVIVLAAIWGISAYNGLVKAEVDVDKQWANVESQYQRRADLIDNLVATVKGYATHEKETFENVVNARAKATQIQVNADNLTPAKMQEFQAAQGELSSALGKLLMVVENYPDLKANQNFLELQAQLEGTENRIQVERMRYNEIAGTFNKAIRIFPKSVIASLAGFERKPFFEADETAKTAPKVQF